MGRGAKRKRLLVLFGNQVFPDERIDEAEADVVFMAESEKACRSYRAHRHKLVLILSAMRSKADLLRESGYEVAYTRLEDDGGRALGTILSDHLANERYQELVHFETESRGMDARLEALCSEHGLVRKTLQSPMFVTAREEFAAYRDSHKRLFMADFYRRQRKRMDILV
ncbi:MAG: cryptochrome/photolyase family protein, partial [Myxococcales bacterium]|nr:cryptochrome/photolyase family protein [Myxococcales bacterium]